MPHKFCRHYFGSGTEASLRVDAAGPVLEIHKLTGLPPKSSTEIQVELWLQPVDQHLLAAGPASCLWRRTFRLAATTETGRMTWALPAFFTPEILDRVHVRLLIDPPV
jgi:hypothetical protein